MTQKHTPLPWILNKDTNDIVDTSSRMIARGYEIHGHDVVDEAYSSRKVLKAQDDGGTANAAFIVRACNNHYSAKALIERLLKEYQKRITDDELDTHLVNSAYAWIAKAEGGAA